jgi:hypothetical protein
VLDGLRAGQFKDRSQFYTDLAIQFYGANRPGAKVPVVAPGPRAQRPGPIPHHDAPRLGK